MYRKKKWISPGSLGVFLSWDRKNHPYDPLVQNVEEEPRSPFSNLALEPNNGKIVLHLPIFGIFGYFRDAYIHIGSKMQTVEEEPRSPFSSLA